MSTEQKKLIVKVFEEVAEKLDLTFRIVHEETSKGETVSLEVSAVIFVNIRGNDNSSYDFKVEILSDYFGYIGSIISFVSSTKVIKQKRIKRFTTRVLLAYIRRCISC